MKLLDTNFHYRNGELYCEEVRISQLAQEFGTPLYVYSRSYIEERFKKYAHSLMEGGIVCYSVKANSSTVIIRLMAEMGAGADIVSGGELFRALKAGVNPSRIVFSGVGKTPSEIKEALKAGILMFNVESLSELKMINKIAEEIDVVAPVSIRINPGIEIPTHPYISTGWKKAKFGIPEEDAIEAYHEMRKMKNVKPVGIDCHIGSQILDLEPFEKAYTRIGEIFQRLRGEGIETLRYIDFGGGLGISYREDEKAPDVEDYVSLVNSIAEKVGAIPVVEPGRSIVGNAGAVVGKVIYVKRTPFKNFIITDIGMNDLLRPPLYRAYHKVVPVNVPESVREDVFDIVGPICESGDFVAQERPFVDIEEGELLAVLSAGAYGFSMASNYNSRPKPAEVLVSGSSYFLIRRRETYEDLIQTELLEGK